MTGFILILIFVVIPLSAFLLVKTGKSGPLLRFLGYDTKCPFCGSEDIRESQIFAGTKKDSSGKSYNIYTLKYDCSSCGKHWEKEHDEDSLLYTSIKLFDRKRKNIKRIS